MFMAQKVGGRGGGGTYMDKLHTGTPPNYI